MSIESSQYSEKRKSKELKVLELHHQGYPYRNIASVVHVSLRDVTKYIHRISNKTKSPSTVSIMDEVVLEYRVNLLRSEVRNLEKERDNLKNKVKDLRAQEYDLLNRLRTNQSELDVVKRNLEYERFSKEILEGIFTEGQVTT
jgi:predicted  nucleic acid-binding Zn-ribbon protein